jgi:hypothetical protein
MHAGLAESAFPRQLSLANAGTEQIAFLEGTGEVSQLERFPEATGVESSDALTAALSPSRLAWTSLSSGLAIWFCAPLSIACKVGQGGGGGGRGASARMVVLASVVGLDVGRDGGWGVGAPVGV